MRIRDLVVPLNATVIGNDTEYQSVSIDTRKIQPGALYIAIKGDRFNGHDFIGDALEKGAVAVIASEPTDYQPAIMVDNTRQALMDLAHYHRQRINTQIVAVTGSCGKTTTKNILQTILSLHGKSFASEKSYNNDIGVPLSLLSVTDHRYFVCEIGANKPGEIALLTEIVRPHVAMILNAAEAHLEGFGDLSGVASAKAEIYEGLGDDGVAIINADDDFADDWREVNVDRRVLTFGIEQSADVMAKSISLNAAHQPSFTLVTPQGEVGCSLGLLGEHNVMNALAAAAACVALGVELMTIKKGLELSIATDQRLVPAMLKQGIQLIDDSYNANPRSVQSAIEILSRLPGKRVMVFGDMGELGERSVDYHREVGALAKSHGIDVLLCIGENSQHAVSAFGEGACHCRDHLALWEGLKSHLSGLSEEVSILVKGSRFMEMNIISTYLQKEEW